MENFLVRDIYLLVLATKSYVVYIHRRECVQFLLRSQCSVSSILKFSPSPTDSSYGNTQSCVKSQVKVPPTPYKHNIQHPPEVLPLPPKPGCCDFFSTILHLVGGYVITILTSRYRKAQPHDAQFRGNKSAWWECLDGEFSLLTANTSRGVS